MLGTHELCPLAKVSGGLSAISKASMGLWQACTTFLPAEVLEQLLKDYPALPRLAFAWMPCEGLIEVKLLTHLHATCFQSRKEPHFIGGESGDSFTFSMDLGLLNCTGTKLGIVLYYNYTTSVFCLFFVVGTW